MKVKNIVNHYWCPNDLCKEWVEKSGEMFIHTTANDNLLKDGWCYDHLLFERDFYDNIANLNRRLNELTSAYLAWKNKDKLGLLDVDYIGLCHYRRFFMQDVLQRTIEEHSPDIVAMPPAPIGVCRNIHSQYCAAHYPDDWDKLAKSVADNYKDYDKELWVKWSLDYPMLIYPCNLLTMRPELFDKWMEDMFSVMMPLVDKIDVEGRDNYQKRAWGFLSERFTSFWTLTQRIINKRSVAVCPIEFHPDWKPGGAWDVRGNKEKV